MLILNTKSTTLACGSTWNAEVECVDGREDVFLDHPGDDETFCIRHHLISSLLNYRICLFDLALQSTGMTISDFYPSIYLKLLF